MLQYIGICPKAVSPSYGDGSNPACRAANQLRPEDTLIDRGIDDMLDEGYSPPERLYGPGAFGPSESMDQMLAEEELGSGVANQHPAR